MVCTGTYKSNKVIIKISNKTVCDKKEIQKGRKNVRVGATAERNIYGSVTLVSARHSLTLFTLRGGS